jgi:hypothetical protein
METESQSKTYKNALYYLQLTKDKMNSESLLRLKCLLYYLMRKGIVQENLAVEIHIIGEGVESLKSEYQLILKLLFNIYNLLEPEHSKQFPLVHLDVLIP